MKIEFKHPHQYVKCAVFRQWILLELRLKPLPDYRVIPNGSTREKHLVQ